MLQVKFSIYFVELTDIGVNLFLSFMTDIKWGHNRLDNLINTISNLIR